MDIIQNLNLATAGELLLSSFLIGLITQGIKSTGKVSANFIPLVSMAVGVIVGLVAVLITKDTNYVGGAVAGLIIGAGTSGLVDLSKGTVNSVKTANDNKQAKQVATINQAVTNYLESKEEADVKK